MDLAEAMLRPLDDVDAAAELSLLPQAAADGLATRAPRPAQTPTAADSWLLDDEPFADARPLSPAAERHLQRRRQPRRNLSRRPGTVAPAPAPCTTPIAALGRRPAALTERRLPTLPRS